MKKNTFNPSYILNQFMLFYKDKTSSIKMKHRMLGIDERMEKCFNKTFFSLFFTNSEIMYGKSNFRRRPEF